METVDFVVKEEVVKGESDAAKHLLSVIKRISVERDLYFEVSQVGNCLRLSCKHVGFSFK